MGLEEYERVVADHVGVTLGGLTARELNPRNYQLARQVVAELFDREAGGHDRGTWITVPIDPVHGAPREPTPVLSDLNFDRLRSEDFVSSAVGRRVLDLLLVPVVKPAVDDPAGWWLSVPFRWRPSDDDLQQLGRDYEALRTYARQGRADDLSSGRDAPGRLLMAKTNGRDHRDVVRYYDGEGRERTARRRGYYLRAAVVSDLLTAVPTEPAAARAELGPPPEVIDAAAELAELDVRAESLRRTEQGYLRTRLLGDATEADCDLCGRSFPSELLVAAHIKPRYECTDEERRDIPAVAMLACRFGCDDLYERGLLAVDEGGRVLVANYDGGSLSLRRYLDGMRGRQVGDAWPRGRDYFAWHCEHAFQG